MIRRVLLRRRLARHCASLRGLALAALALCFVAAPAHAEPAVDFERSIAPILVKHCVACHAGDDPRGGLDLTSRAKALVGGDSGPILVAGSAAESSLIERVAEASMPPEGKGTPLAADQVTALRAWINAGAEWPAERVLSPFEFTTERRAGFDWWSLQPVGQPAVPKVENAAWVSDPLDAFVLARLEADQLAPAPPVDKLVYLRRATFDLLGLPPTLEQIDEFVADTTAEAYERLIDRLLASPQYGERWARHWLDVVRFGESDGFEQDQFREHAWRYRDYVIDSLNADKPYLQFVREQLAGDVIEPVTREGIVATGMLVAGPWDFAQKVAKSETERLRAREAQLEELVGVVSQTFLGLTVHCARCHNHKFDPIAQTDYYRLKAVFDGIDHSNSSGHEEPIALPAAEQQALAAQQTADRARLDALRAELAKPAEQRPLAEQPNDAEQTALVAEQARLEARLAIQPPRAYTGLRHQPGPTLLYVRGDIATPGQQVVAGGLSALRTPAADLGLTADSPEGERRKRFAQWVADPQNPLTARVMVNRVWQYHFGLPLVENASDFGFNGGLPTHPELLDHLAQRFAAEGYRLKPLHRAILLSATYRQSSRFDARAAERDADNRLLWRFQPRRIEGEAIRDAILAISGRLDLTAGGPSYRPFTVTVFNTYFYHLIDEDRPEFRRRTIYRMQVGTGRDPLLDAIDCPAPSLTVPTRRSTTTAVQALALMNNPFVLGEAAALSERLTAAAGNDRARQIELAYRLAFARAATAAEATAASQLIDQAGLSSLCWTFFNSSEFLYLR